MTEARREKPLHHRVLTYLHQRPRLRLAMIIGLLALLGLGYFVLP